MRIRGKHNDSKEPGVNHGEKFIDADRTSKVPTLSTSINYRKMTNGALVLIMGNGPVFPAAVNLCICRFDAVETVSVQRVSPVELSKIVDNINRL